MLDYAIPAFGPLVREVEAQRGGAGAAALLRCVLEHVDYGLAVVDIGSRQLRLTNSAALRALADEDTSGLCVVAGQVRARRPGDERRLDRAMTLAANGVRELLRLSSASAGGTVAVVPLGDLHPSDSALLVFAKRTLCDRSALALFARACELTAAESSVLAAVCNGMKPEEVAREHGVQVTTIRSQIQSIRQKTRCNSLRELLHSVSRLPPVARQMG